MHRATLVAAIFIAGSAHAFDIKGIAPGMSLAEVEALHPGISGHCRIKGENGKQCMYIGPAGRTRSRTPGIEALETYGGHQSRYIAFQVIDDKVTNVAASIHSKDFDAVANALLAKHGAPDKDLTDTVTTRAGVSFDQRTLHWKKGEFMLMAKKRANNIDESYISASTESDRQRFEEEQKKKTQAATKDL